MSIITKLSEKLLPKLEAADELWVAVALINLNGLNFLLDKTQKNCIRNFLLGINLPTDPKALDKLNELQWKPNLYVRLFTDREFYHPKMYLVRSNRTFSGFIGSANCTNGGLNENVELTIQADDPIICADLKSWFEERFDRANPLTSSFLKTYQVDYSERRRRQSEDEKVVRTEKIALNQQFKMKSKESPIELARKFKRLLDEDVPRIEIRKRFPRPGGRKGVKEQPLSNSTINIYVSFLKFPKAIQEKIDDGHLTVGGADELTKSTPKMWASVLKRAEDDCRAKGKKSVGRQDIEYAAYYFKYAASQS